MIKLLSNIRVLECAILPTGDHAGRMLGDLGAQIIKIEQPGVGDYIRVLGGEIVPEHSPTHLFTNRHKRSLTLNLKSEEGRKIFYELLPTTDIVVDGFAGSACKRLGIGYEDLRRAKPDIIFMQASGFGANGPYGQLPVHGYMMAAVAGSPRLRVREDGFVEEVVEPVQDRNWPGYVDSPQMGGIFGAMAAIAALNYRNVTGKGVYIDSSAVDGTLTAMGIDANIVWNRERTVMPENIPPYIGQDPKGRPKYAYYLTKDKKIVQLAAIEHKFWDNFCRAVDRPDLQETRFSGSPVDFRNVGGRADLADQIKAIMLTRSAAEWVEAARAFDFPLSPANTLEEAKDDPHLRAREIIYETVHPIAGAYTTIGWPAPVSGQPFSIELEAPTLGQHTDEILSELGRSAQDILALRERGIV